MQVVIVESPAKAKTINKYLGGGYQVLASFGHVRDLPAKDGSVDPEHDFKMTYEVMNDSERQIRDIAKAVKSADTLLLATDPDREGEAISWHVAEVLKERGALKANTTVKRVVFNEITKSAVKHGVDHPRELDMNLVNAQQARRALDYLVGFTLSPILWRKLPGSRSAGRVQSVALRLICERENEIEKFRQQEYWDITALLATAQGETFPARLTHYRGEKLEQFSITKQDQAEAIVKDLNGTGLTIASLEEKQSRRNPYPPFTTSTLQQEASRKLGFGAKRTMQLAQKLYEGFDIGGETVGLITYMRTDGVQVSQEAVTQARQMISENYGATYVPSSPRMYKTKAKNAQEAHEAIRPTDLKRSPDKMAKFLPRDEHRLYELIWKRMVASQMESAIFDQVVATLDAKEKNATFRANGSVLKFDGFLRLYREDLDDSDDSDENRKLPPLSQGQSVNMQSLTPNQHFTQPPPRYTEASLVKKLEELGIGRPSTYASIISVLQDRAYVKLDKKRFIPEARGRIVTGFLTEYFPRYVEYSFTADLEEKLDNVSAGEMDWKALLREFWKPFSSKADEVGQQKNADIIQSVENALADFIFPQIGEGKDPRQCQACGNGRLGLRLGKFGAFVGCSNYPNCNFTRELVPPSGDQPEKPLDSEFPKVLGNHPNGMEVLIKVGPYGPYVQLGDDKQEKPKRLSIPKDLNPSTLELEMALRLLSLPREVGTHPETQDAILAGIGKFGPYLNYQGRYVNLGSTEDVLTIGLNRAVDLLASKPGKPKASAKVLGNHPDTGKPVEVAVGRFGPYLRHDRNNFRMPKGKNAETITLEEAIAAMQPTGDKPSATDKGTKKTADKKASPKKSAAKTKTAKAPAASSKAKAKTKAAR